MLRFLAFVAVSIALVLTAFTAPILPAETPTLPETPYNYADIALPEHLRINVAAGSDNMPSSNPVTDAGATLGRVLFYDTRLSANRRVSCGSCHLQERAFSDPVSFSTGFAGQQTHRNSMGLVFARFYQNGRFFWDERAETLEDQVLMPIQDDVEMGMTLGDVRARLEATDFYADLFADAFGSPEITNEGMSRALSQFIRSMVAPNSRYDQGRIGQPLTPFTWPKDNFTDQENHGVRLFYGKAECANCHFGDLQATVETFNTGLDRETTDEGAGGGQFKSPSLRNISVTAPYMHDGRFDTLEEVVDHYDRGVQPHTNLSEQLREINTPPGRPSIPRRLNLTAEEHAALVAFLRTLTDESFLVDERWSDPFAEVVSNEDDAAQPHAAALDAVYPNPFQDETTIQVTFAQATSATVSVYDMMGREVARLADGLQPAGTQTLHWAADGLASGVYLIRLQSAEGVATRTVTLSR